MVQTDWNEALNRPSSTISIFALMLGVWVILLSIINIVEGAYSPGYKVSWIGFLGIEGDASVLHEGIEFALDDILFTLFGLLLIVGGDYGMKKASSNSEGVMAFITGLPNSYFMNNLIRGESAKQTISSWLVVIGVLFYIVWSIQNNTWVDPGVYSVMISLVAFGFALNISSKAEE